MDPPFNSNRNYEAPVGSKAAGAAFKDMWNLSDVDVCEHGELAERSPAAYKVIDAARATHGKGMMSYLIFMAVRLIEMQRILKETGSIYLHCDDTAGSYLKLLLDSIFGASNCRNQIYWKRTASNAKGSQFASKSFGRIADHILHYTNSNNYTFNGSNQDLSPELLKLKFPKVDDDGRRYNTSTPLFRSRTMGDRPNLCYEYNGVSNPYASGWRVSKERLKEMDSRGEIIWRTGKRPLRKSYADNYKGIPLGNIWTDIPNARGKEATGYPTQKPLALLERIIKTSSRKGDIVFDPFCGCATTLVTAYNLGRRWIGCDLSELAVRLVNRRILEFDPLFAKAINPDGPPARTDTRSLKNYRLNKHKLFGLQEGICNGCDTQFPFKIMEVDHILPQSRGGTDEISNLQILCSHCNRSKGNKTMAEWRAGSFV